MTIHLDWKIKNDQLEAVCIINRHTYKAYITPVNNPGQMSSAGWPLPDITAQYTILKDEETMDQNENVLRQLEDPRQNNLYGDATGILLAMRLVRDKINRYAAHQVTKDQAEETKLEKTHKAMRDAITFYRTQA